MPARMEQRYERSKVIIDKWVINVIISYCCLVIPVSGGGSPD